MSSSARNRSPLLFHVQNEAILVRSLSEGCAEPMLDFARKLPAEDLLFLERDITQQASVDQWVQQASAGELYTLVAYCDEEIVGYATFARGNAPWTQHVGELRVVVAESMRGCGIGRLLLQLVFETALEEEVVKLVARMTPEQIEARRLFEQLGFEQEAILRDHSMDSNGLTHDLVMLSYHTKLHQESRCSACGVQVLSALCLDGNQLCSSCYEIQYQELGDGG
jgi:L-amino acid N-acyltransferase YncA